MRKGCRFINKINAYLDGELNEKESRSIREHLGSCPSCQQAIREINMINDHLNEFPVEEVPEYLNQKILANIPEAQEKAFSLKNAFRSPRWALAAGICAAFLIGAYLSNYTFSTSEQYSYDLGEETLYSFFEGVD